jgi:hypothetical protein
MADYPERLPACHCHQNAREMVRRHPELRYVEGYLVFPRPEPFSNFRLAHAWNEVDGRIVDSTAWAYESLRPFSYEPAPK